MIPKSCGLLLISTASVFAAPEDVEMSGRLRAPETDPPLLLAAVRCFGREQSAQQVTGFRTWEMEPRGWWKLQGPPGDWTVIFSGPAHFVRPTILSAHLSAGEKRGGFRPQPQFDYVCFHESDWDKKPASTYWQPFTARSHSVTHVGFKLATDGVDGPGPAGQTLIVSVHRIAGEDPNTWPQCGPETPVPAVDCGGAKSHSFSAGWHSGEAPTDPGQRYAVRLRSATNQPFQAFWEKCDSTASCRREAADRTVGTPHFRLWMTISGDGDGLLLPMNKRIHREFGEFAGYAPRWTQTWKAKGHGMAAVFLYAATSGVQPPMDRQHVAVRIHRGGVDGPLAGPEILAFGNGTYTGDACWGVFGAVWPAGQVKLTPGEVCAAEFVTKETPDSIGNFVNIKGQPSDRKPGFNPYRRPAADAFADGTACKNGTDPADFDLDMQVVEYEAP